MSKVTCKTSRKKSCECATLALYLAAVLFVIGITAIIIVTIIVNDTFNSMEKFDEPKIKDDVGEVVFAFLFVIVVLAALTPFIVAVCYIAIAGLILISLALFIATITLWAKKGTNTFVKKWYGILLIFLCFADIAFWLHFARET